MPERGESETRADVARRLDRPETYGPTSYEIGSADDPDCGRARTPRHERRRPADAGHVRAADRGQGRLVVADHRGRRHRPRPDPPPGRRARRTPAAGAEVVLVSSGAIAAGLAPLGLARRPRALAAQQAAASVGQGLLVHRYTEELARHGIVAGQVLLTNDDMTRRSHYRNAYQTFAKLLELGVLPIVNENDTVATTEIRFGDNDRLAALVAHLVHADLLVLLSDVDGLYDGDPAEPGHLPGPRGRGRRRPGPRPDRPHRRRRRRHRRHADQGRGRPDRHRRRASRSSSPPPSRRRAALAGEPVGTLFHATGRRRPTRLLWLAHATEPKGQLVLDAGAVRAVTERRASLLAAGITGVTGSVRRRRPRRPHRPRRPAGRPRPGQLRRRGDPRACSAAPRTSSSASSGRRTSARSCTATTCAALSSAG